MALAEIGASTLFLVITITFYYYLKIKFNSTNSFIITLSLLVPLMSHFWHLVFDEAIIGSYCDIDKDKMFEWTKCIEEAGWYNVYLNSYEITVPVEILILNSIGMGLFLKLANEDDQEQMKKTNYSIITVLLLVGILISLALPILTTTQLEDLKMTYNISGMGIHALATFFLLITA